MINSKFRSIFTGTIFAVAIVKVQPERENEYYPPGLLIAFGATVLFVLRIRTCILPNLEAAGDVHNLNSVKESHHEWMLCHIELAWTFSTIIGTFLCLAEFLLLCWVKFLSLKKAELKELNNLTRGGRYGSKIISR
uniref:Calcium release-activated calcium channel protein 1 n=1 Tax=Astyanax mexicanus TaxID=7994 RepID=A0A8B9KJX1_ASTMX